jgi:protein-tyrosine phosphatase
MWRIVRGLYLGDARDALDRELLLGAGVTHVLNCAREVPCQFRGEFRYCHLRMSDPDPAFEGEIERVCRFIRRGRRAGAVLVHCAAGLSRSAAAVLAYLCSRGRSLEESLDLLRRRVGETDEEFVEPDASFLVQIESYFGD